MVYPFRVEMKRRPATTARQRIAATAFYASASPREVDIPEIPKARAKATPWEHIEQVKVIKWWRGHYADYELPEMVLFAIPNAGKRSLHVGEAMRAEGLRKGAPDLLLMTPRSTHLGLAIEMKPSRGNGGTWEKEQQEFCALLQGQGYQYSLCRGADEAIATIKAYLG